MCPFSAEPVSDETEQQVVRGAIDRWGREPDLERVAMPTTDLGAGRPGLDMELNTDTTGNCSDHDCWLRATGYGLPGTGTGNGRNSNHYLPKLQKRRPMLRLAHDPSPAARRRLSQKSEDQRSR